MNEQEAIPQQIQSEIDWLTDQIKAYVGIIPIYKTARAISLLHPENFISVAVGSRNCTLNYIAGSLSEAAPILRTLAKQGYKQAGEISDYPGIKLRQWRCGQIYLNLYFDQAEAQCSFKKVGEKTETHDVYELQCD